MLGHEEILVEISRTFGSKIFVDKRKNWDCYRSLRLTAPKIISDDPSCRFQIIGLAGLHAIATEIISEAKAQHQPQPVFIRPSTQWYAKSTDRPAPCLDEAVRDEHGIWHVCYSIHSSRDELEWALQLLQPMWVISTTPPCFAMELSYVKKHCFKTRLTVDDPLWKIFQDPLQKAATLPLPESVDGTTIDQTSSSLSMVSEERVPDPIDEIQELISPVQEPEITLFGKARFGLEESGMLMLNLPADLGNIPTLSSDKHYSSDDDTGTGETSAAGKVNAPLVDEAERVQMLVIDDGHSSELPVHEHEEVSKTSSNIPENPDNSSIIGSSACLNVSLRKMYRSRNIPVPRPLPSLVGILESSKRAKLHSGLRLGRLSTSHSLP